MRDGLRHQGGRRPPLPAHAGVQTGAHLSVILRAFYDLFRLRQKIIADG